jgi:hypothetical protein
MEHIIKNMVITNAHSITMLYSLIDAQKNEQLLETKSVKYVDIRLVDDENEVNEWLENSDDEKSKGKIIIQGTSPHGPTNANNTIDVHY